MKVTKFFTLAMFFCCVVSAACFAQDTAATEKKEDSPATEKSEKMDMKTQIFRIMLTTGEFYTGRVDGIKKDFIFINKDSYRSTSSLSRKLKKETGKIKIPIQNVVDISPLEEGQDPTAVPENLSHYFKNGRQMLDNGQPEIAEILFRLAIYYMPKKGTKAVEKIYKDAGSEMPDSLKNTDKVRAYWQYRLPNPAEILASVEWAADTAKAMKKIAPSTHTIETEHFIIYSAWSRSDDKALKVIYENLYKKLCNQFNIDKDENVWVGKLAVFAFWKKNEFMEFMGGPLEINGPLAMIGGLCGSKPVKNGMVTFVSLGPVDVGDKSKSKTWFFELLVHETTHGFVGRYINSNVIPNWVNEGLAEMMASTLVPGSGAMAKFRQASLSIAQGQSPECIFDCKNIPLNAFSYGAAQSAVRYLVGVDRKKFINFVKKLKEGDSDSDALESAYGFDRKKMVTQWQKSAGKKPR